MHRSSVFVIRLRVIGLLLTVLAISILFARFENVESSAKLTKRSFENKIPEHVPLKIKIKKVKEDKVLDLKNGDWFRDFELEVTNNSEKPIYYLSMSLLMPELVGQTGGELAFALRYGDVRFQLSQRAKPSPEDVPIEPKATCTFVIKDQQQEGYPMWLQSNQKTDPTKLELILNHLSFGDGTGFTTTGGLPFPFKQN